MKRITVKGIAKLAGVSPGTVDRVLHNRGEVSKRTKKKVINICNKYNYKPNLIGKILLMQNKQNTVAVILNAVGENKYADLIRKGIKDYSKDIKEFNIDFEFFNYSSFEEEEIIDILEKVEEKNYLGLIITPIENDKIIRKINQISQSKNIPVVTCPNKTSGIDALCQVQRDDEKEGRMAASVLTKIIHDEIRLLVILSSFPSITRMQKYEGFISYLEQNDIKYQIGKKVKINEVNESFSKQIESSFENVHDVNAVYLNTSPRKVKEALEIIKKMKKFNGVIFSYGDRNSLKESVKDKTLSYAIYEDPHNMGVLSAKIICEYIMFEKKPEKNIQYSNVFIVFDENC